MLVERGPKMLLKEAFKVDGRLVGGAMAKPELGRGGRARGPARLTGALTPGTLTPRHPAPAVGRVIAAPAPSQDRLGLN